MLRVVFGAGMSSVTHPTPEQQGWFGQIAQSVARTNPELSVEDVKQELFLLWYSKFESIRRYVEMESEQDRNALLYRTLTTWAVGYCKREAVQAGRVVRADDIYYYSRRQIQDMLPMVEDPGSWSSLSVVGDGVGRSGKLASHGNDVLAHYADLRTAWGSLTSDQRALLRARYPRTDGGETPYAELAEERGLSEAHVRQQVSRAITNMQKVMGGRRREDQRKRRQAIADGEGSRRQVMSNAQAIVLTRKAFDGD